MVIASKKLQVARMIWRCIFESSISLLLVLTIAFNFGRRAIFPPSIRQFWVCHLSICVLNFSSVDFRFVICQFAFLTWIFLRQWFLSPFIRQFWICHLSICKFLTRVFSQRWFPIFRVLEQDFVQRWTFEGKLHFTQKLSIPFVQFPPFQFIIIFFFSPFAFRKIEIEFV